MYGHVHVQTFIQAITSSYRYMVWMEPDVLPVQPYWADALYKNSILNPSNFWVLGGLWVRMQ